MSGETKRCAKCKKELLLKYFGKDKGRKDGLTHYCMPCKIKHTNKWKQLNPDKVKEHDSRHYKSNSQKIKKRVNIYYLEHHTNILKRMEKYRKNNPEKVKASRLKHILDRDLISTMPTEFIKARILVFNIRSLIIMYGKGVRQ